MRPLSSTPMIAACALVGALAVSCGGDDATTNTTATTVGPATSAAPAALVHGDVTYANSVPADWLPATLDVYAPPGAAGLPLVVFLHGGGVDKRSLQYQELAAALVAKGAVVVSANWGPTVMPGGRKSSGWTAAQILEEQRLVADETACAVSFAVAHAAEYGADPTRVVLAGHSAGASLAAEVALTTTRPLAGCGATPVFPALKGLMLWDGDWMMTDPSLDVIGSDLAALVPLYSPWPVLADAHTTATVELAITTNSSRYAFRDATPSTDWVTWRDPAGTMTKDLQQIDAFADDRIDIVDVTKAFSAGLTAHGIANTVLVLHDPSTDHVFLAKADFDLFVDHVLALAR